MEAAGKGRSRGFTSGAVRHSATKPRSDSKDQKSIPLLRHKIEDLLEGVKVKAASWFCGGASIPGRKGVVVKNGKKYMVYKGEVMNVRRYSRLPLAALIIGVLVTGCAFTQYGKMRVAEKSDLATVQSLQENWQ
jgi:hypothetical protein